MKFFFDLEKHFFQKRKFLFWKDLPNLEMISKKGNFDGLCKQGL